MDYEEQDGSSADRDDPGNGNSGAGDGAWRDLAAGGLSPRGGFPGMGESRAETRSKLQVISRIPDKRSNMTISLKQKLLAGFAVNVLLTVVSSLCIMVQVQHMRVIEKQVNTVRIPSTLAAVGLSRYISDAGFQFRNFLLYHADPALGSKYETARQAGWKNLFARFDTLKRLAPPEDEELLAQLDSDIRNGSLKIQEDALADMQDGSEEGMHKALERMKGGSALSAKVQADAVEVTRRVEERLGNDDAALASAQSTTWTMALIAGLLTAFSGILIGVVLSQQILGGLEKISGRLGDVAKGDLSGRPLTYGANDEIGAAVESINSMEVNLRRIIQSVRDSSDQVATAAVELSASSEELLQNATLQKSQSHKIVITMEQMSSAIAEVSANASRAAQGAVTARKVAHEGGEVVGETVSAMQNLTATNRATSAQIEGLAISSNKIGKVLSVIGEIAEQTNLLALNAAIEAARAGEQGRGFAVVAGEVRRLAERTAQATREIGEMITGIQSEAQKAVESIKMEIVHVNESTESASRAGSSINGIIEASDNVKEMISQIATASMEQSAATDEVNRTLKEIAQVIDHSTAGTQDSAKASAELSRLAGDLQAHVSEFRLAS
jgi:methyl-accepting chemotaxis protein